MKMKLCLPTLSMIILTLTLLFACSESNDTSTLAENTIKVENIKQLADDNKTFGWNLFNAELDQQRDKNVIISPLSAQIALYMATNGAKGTTQNEMLEMLQCKDCDIKSINEKTKDLVQYLTLYSGHPTLSIANGFFYDDKRLKTLNPIFVNDLADYECVFEKSNFSDEDALLKLINDWVKIKTKNKIDKILTEIKDQDIAFLINALYFKADWSIGFNENLTQQREFKTSKGENKLVTYMGDFRAVPLFLDKNTKVADIPFRDSTYSLTLISLENDLEALTAKTYQDLLSKVIYKNTVLNFPKINGEYENDIINSLQKLGMKKAFDSGSADFSNIGTANNRIFINQIKHKVVLEADEKGIEGAAVTSIGVGITEAPPSITFDKPFYIVLRHIDTNTILFLGKINDPSL